MGNSERSTKRLRIRWDEGNLSENERIKADLNPRKIEEPKTPFHSPPREEDFELEGEPVYDPVNLNLQNGAHKATEATSSGGPSGVVANGDANHASTTLASASNLSEQTEEPLNVENGDGSGKSHKPFDAHRKAHYNMAAALKRGKELLEQEEEDEEGEDNAK